MPRQLCLCLVRRLRSTSKTQRYFGLCTRCRRLPTRSTTAKGLRVRTHVAAEEFASRLDASETASASLLDGAAVRLRALLAAFSLCLHHSLLFVRVLLQFYKSSKAQKMAEARSAAALSFHLTHDGVSVSYDQELLRDIWHAFSRGHKRRIARFKNDFVTGIFPASTTSFALTVLLFMAVAMLGLDISFGVVPWVQSHIFYYVLGEGKISHAVASGVCGAIIWFLGIQVIRLSLKMLLSYKGWMYESAHLGKISMPTLIWLKILHLISRSQPMLHSFQGALPHLPLPSLDQTLKTHLRSIRPFYSDEEYAEIAELSEKFRKGIGQRLQRYLTIKSWLSINYVTDWWEEFVYLRQRSPIMVNSNYYGFDTLYEPPTTKQAARAANITWAALQFRRMVERQEVTPFSISPRYKVPFCTMQYERLFNSCRIPGEETDTLKRWDDVQHIAVYHKGCWYRMPIHSGKRLLDPPELQLAFQSIIDGSHEPAAGERDLAALTAGDRIPWAKARKEFFSSGINKTSLHCIEKAAFCVILDEEPVYYDPKDPSKLDRWAHILLHGNANNRWFDKSFNFCVSTNARVGVNTEHSWGDAAVTAHFVEYCLLKDLYLQAYDAEGNTVGSAQVTIVPERLQWELSSE
uniref:carnitine O-palmitoyltransferase n=1 Tax=Plectus sambesii TaxID=2011161 RepID=A0A914X4N2_9BILA